MAGILWGWVTAAAGVVILALLIWYGTISGTWADEHSSLLVDGTGEAVEQPTLIPLALLGIIALVLFFGGLFVAVKGVPRGAEE